MTRRKPEYPPQPPYRPTRVVFPPLPFKPRQRRVRSRLPGFPAPPGWKREFHKSYADDPKPTPEDAYKDLDREDFGDE